MKQDSGPALCVLYLPRHSFLLEAQGGENCSECAPQRQAFVRNTLLAAEHPGLPLNGAT